MFESLTDRIQHVFAGLLGFGRLSEKQIDEALREIQRALLEADVNYRVVKNFIEGVRRAAAGREILESLTPAQEVIRIVRDQMTEVLGGRTVDLSLPAPMTVMMLCGLQGAGKTTTAVKLGLRTRDRDQRMPLLVACDTERPAARDQLLALADAAGIDAVAPHESDPVTAAAAGVDAATDHDVVILDTQGRGHIDERLMQGLAAIKRAAMPHVTVLVVDAMTGHLAVSVAETFSDSIGVDGFVLTKLDGDARGGAALSLAAVTGHPIYFIGTGEQAEDLEVFHPDRIANRILGMGDVLSLIERAERGAMADADAVAKKIAREGFSFEDFLDQMESMRRMGPLDEIVKMLPGGMKIDTSTVESDSRKIRAIIESMTLEERRSPSIIGASRKERIARGSGTTVQDVNRLLRQFAETKKMMRTALKAGKGRRKGPFPR